jgi:catechol 2,3-dioxygenase-like lactoylglutathione lyase family enzyme
MIKPRRIGHATFETPDLGKSHRVLREVHGIDRGGARKGSRIPCQQGRAARDPAQQGRPGALHQTVVRSRTQFRPWRVGAGIVQRRRAQRAAQGLNSGDGQVVSFQDDKGTTIELFKEWSYLGKHEQVAGIGPLKLGHVAFYTPEIKRTVAFYEKVLGFRVSDWIGDFFCFMRCNSDHHTVNFFTGPNAKLHHIAFELKDFMHLQNSCELMGQKQVPIIWGPLRHGPGHNIATYHRNQDEHWSSFSASWTR